MAAGLRSEAMNNLFGVKIIEDASLTIPGKPYQVKRTWKERLFTRPWKPLKVTSTVVPQIPNPEIICYGSQIMAMHPEIAKQLRHSINQAGDGFPTK